MISEAWLTHSALMKVYTGMLLALAKGTYGVAAPFITSKLSTEVGSSSVHVQIC